MLSLRSYRALIWSGLTLAASIGIGYWAYLFYAGERLLEGALAAGSAEMQRTAATTADRFSSAVREVDFVLLDMRNDLSLPEKTAAAQAEQSRALFGGDIDFALSRFGRQGELIDSSIAAALPLNVADRDYFRYFADDRGPDSLFISTQQVGRHTGRPRIFFVRPLYGPGTFDGVLLCSLDPAYLSGRLALLGTGGAGRIALRHRSDGSLIAGSADDGPTALAPAIAAPAAEDRGAHIFGDGAAAQLVAWQQVPGTPLVVTVGRTVDELLAPARSEVSDHFAKSALATALLTLLIAGGSALLLRDIRLRRLIQLSDARYARLFEAIPDGLVLVDQGDDIVLWNQSALDLLGVDATALKERRTVLFDETGRPLPLHLYPSMRANRQVSAVALHSVRTSGGHLRWLSFNTRQLPAAGDLPGGAVISFSDVSRLVMLEDSLQISQSVFMTAGEGIMVTDRNRRIIRVNPAFTAITGYSSEEALGRSPRELLGSGTHDSTFFDAMLQDLAQKGHWEGEITNRRKDGQLFVEWLKINTVRDAAGNLIRYVALLSDITARKMRDQEIWHRANFDALTGLPNRTLVMDRLGQALPQAARQRDQVGILFIDLDKFKPVNDLLGHRAGDELLCQVAARLAAAVRSEDTVARIGGDEFLALMPLIGSMDHLKAAAERIRAALAAPFTIGSDVVHISASIGVAADAGANANPGNLIKKADAAMYLAKSRGGNQIESRL
ncbi:bifunctional diguanylate cyclase/phosphodiesterase [Zavarzinia compransoris]|uniref:Diguanylate cyclase n=1 Tax=Zavarzinia compransoris TaxID=1264899 RepID=A0A317DYG4_9PROT|nr:diguanylate cyclase [Zavarzinia compransoris]PWR19709.1 hypothetical protein DKG75_14675 [Zavarzinia compransoris]TDP43345.1 PAS domain S-box-containing protein/diguanylate cyclase (GGDEF)-like protein [Zavarzinia compransoris]